MSIKKQIRIIDDYKWGYQKDDVFIGKRDEGNLGGKICLPHSCDEWIIGGKKQARELIQDLKKFIKYYGPKKFKEFNPDPEKQAYYEKRYK